jgi:uncharacterized protein with HEPN domain
MHEVLKERLQFIVQHEMVIEERVHGVKKANDFVASKEGQILLDSLITRLQALSENIKQIQKWDCSFFEISLPLNVGPVVRFRDLASHHYESLNYAVIYNICKEEIPRIKSLVQQFLEKEL